jgi:hypothetical protein
VALNAVSAMELIVLASHLVKIVDARLEARERAKLASAFTRFDLNVVDYVEENESSIRSIAFNGRVIAECTTFDSEDNPYTHAVCYLTAGRKLVLTLMETGDNTIYHLATYDNLAAFADDPQFLESFPDSDRVRFLNKIREVTNQEWAKWIE